MRDFLNGIYLVTLHMLGGSGLEVQTRPNLLFPPHPLFVYSNNTFYISHRQAVQVR